MAQSDYFSSKITHRQCIGIIGATGNVGSALLKILKQEYIQIFALARDPDKVNQGENISFRFFDFTKIDVKAFDNIQKLFWLTPNNEGAIDEQWLSILKKSAISHVVLLSSMHPEIFYLDSSESFIKQSDIPYTILRPNTFMQNFNNHERNSVINDQAFYFPGGFGKTSFIDIRDIAEAAANILMNDSHHNKIYTLTGSEALDYYQVASIFSEVCKKTIRYIDTYKFPEHETEEKKNNFMRQEFFAGVRNNLFAEVTEDLEFILGKKTKSFREYVEDYWK